MSIARSALAGIVSIGATLGCGSVADSDPAFWQQGTDIGGTQYRFGGPGAPAATGTPGNPGPTSTVTGQPPPAPTGTDSPQGNGGSIGAGGFGNTGNTGNTGNFGGSTTNPVPTATGTTTAPPPPPPPPGTNSGTCNFTFNVTTVTANGTYAPRNVGAIWIQDSAGKFVKTLKEWGIQRISNATAWETASGGNTVDAVTSATRSGHGAISGTWNCTDVSHNPVGDGQYTVNVTFAESDAFPFFGPAPIQASVTFNKGSGVQPSGSGADTANFKGMTFTYQ